MGNPAPSSSCQENGVIVINSGERLTIETVADFTRLIREGLSASKDVAVEFDANVEVDITALQVICSACKTAVAEGSTFTVRGSQPKVLADLIAASGAARHGLCKHNNNAACAWFGGEN